MRLTNAIKEQLIRDVIEDQFRDEFTALDNEFKETFKQEVVDTYGDLYVEMQRLAKAYKIPEGIFCNANLSVRITHLGSLVQNDAIRRHPFVKESKYSSTNLVCAFKREIHPGIFVPPTNEWGERALEVSNYPKTQKVLQKQKEWVSKTSGIVDDLCDVLKAATTDKALKGLTSVFTPFLPLDNASKALVPAEALLRINELKSPKKGKKKA
ncbi:hypothetical protein AD45P2_00175 [Alteromonas phage vB_AmaP_AD45-P2]|uniref:Uncharacterized protein n=1 Tax=Pseudorhizobium pelagicum TaxID=1509405 RepID=A0A922T7A8_9HYPH|nr:hypothetical protein [Pseudorhizobium pelagicum]YP_008126007.1 hypothetical protein M610_gp036 [Alteromonas phage vB_AmaP_AD45-P1]AGM46974.1 hypothetical protein AD45P3_00180 [Alteromonas phage vB_AmaP_AD45-P3]AGM47091.1 hypothetical protein AD45P4_00180 [Alteromonas phage vB_AmaP_AD45-P4]AGM47206.1 hypothetical protein AD45P2_00175 [Alteromonas phage vB_AmaP_AD45-P2]AGM46854.1 hypothetical protein AD45P1_00180 [Alteromonas phage vB_AmaP_AD45-P1]KEQ05556.1 hypothetical protein GV68_08480 [